MSEKNDRNSRWLSVRKNWLEWGVFAVSAVLVVGVLGYLVYDGAGSNGDSPRIAVTLGAPEQQADVYVIPVTIRNTGSHTAEQVAVEVELEGIDGGREVATLELDFLPREGSRRGWVTFRSDPRSARTLRARATSYNEP